MTSKIAVLCVCLSGLMVHDVALARRHGAAPGQAPDYAALAMADDIASDRLYALANGQPMPVSEHVALVDNMDDLPPTGAGRMSSTMRIQPAKAESEQPLQIEKPVGKTSKKLVVPMALEQRQEGEPRFDLSISNAPAEQVFMQLGAGTSYNVLVSQGVTGMVSLQLKNVTVLEAMEALRDLYGYEYKITGKRIMVYANTVQTRVFKINYLPGRRQGSSDLRVSSNSVSDAMSASGDKGGKSDKSSKGQDGSTTNSAQVRTSSDSDFWLELKDSLASMMSTEGGRSVVINPSAGVVVVRATPAEHRAVSDFLKAIQVTIERQVMLEAKIIEVTLSSGSQTGVNWTHFKGTAGDNLAIGGAVAPGISLSNGVLRAGANEISAGNISTDSAGKGFYGLAIQASNFTALINFLETQGDVQVLSSPRIATINSQKAILKVGSDEFFVTGLKTEVTPGTNGGSPVVSPTITVQPFFSGIALDVTPQIDEEGSVILHVHPAVSAVTTKNKEVDLGDLGRFRLPLAASSINETDSIVRVQDGQIVAIGGLMSESNTVDRQGVKGLSRLPMVGDFLFGQKDSANTKRELVILIKPTVIGDDGAGWTRDVPKTSALTFNR
jgi:MSHA biogenesis protein MshL